MGNRGRRAAGGQAGLLTLRPAIPSTARLPCPCPRPPRQFPLEGACAHPPTCLLQKASNASLSALWNSEELPNES